jgi:YidC/Oxa1 family membrane protein insertase
MDRRLLLAFGLMLIVLLLPSILWPPAARRPAPGVIAADSDAVVSDTALPAAAREAVPAPPNAAPPTAVSQAQLTEAVPVDTGSAQLVTVDADLYRFRFSTRGGHLVSAVLKNFRSFVPGDTGQANLIPTESQFLEYALVIGPDTVSLADWVFTPSDSLVRVRDGTARLRMQATRGRVTVALDFTFRADSYLFDVSGEVQGLETGGLVLVRLGPRLAFTEADTVDDVRSYSVVTKASKTERHDFRKLDPGERRSLDGPFDWTAIKSKYFLAALLTIGEDQPTIAGVSVTGGLPIGRHKARVEAVATLPAPSGHFSYSMYVGPQEYRRLKRIGHDL